MHPTNRPKKLATAARIVLGLIFSLSGANHVLGLVPMPAMAGDTALFWQGLQQTGYFFPLLGLLEVAIGALLLSRRWVPLALVAAAPIAFNVVAFHAALAPQGMGIAALLVAAGVVLARHERASFGRVLAARAGATSTGVRATEVVLGLAFVASGVAGLLGRTPPPATAGAAAMMRGLEAAGYFMPVLGGVQVLAGGLLVARRFVGVALVALAPLVVQILAYRLYVAAATPGMTLVAVALVAAELWLAYAHRALFAAFFGGGGVTSPSLPAARLAVPAK